MLTVPAYVSRAVWRKTLRYVKKKRTDERLIGPR